MAHVKKKLQRVEVPNIQGLWSPKTVEVTALETSNLKYGYLDPLGHIATGTTARHPSVSSGSLRPNAGRSNSQKRACYFGVSGREEDWSLVCILAVYCKEHGCISIIMRVPGYFALAAHDPSTGGLRADCRGLSNYGWYTAILE